jgi:hypothetical protein
MWTRRQPYQGYPRYFAEHLQGYRRNVKSFALWSIKAQIEADSNNLPLYEKRGARDEKIGIRAHDYHYVRYLRLRLWICQREVQRRWVKSQKEVNGSLV